MTQTIPVLAWNTVRELVRSKLLYNLVAFAALLIASSILVAQLTIGEWDRIMLDQGLAATEIGGVLIAVIVGVNLVAGEVERRTIYPTLAKPVSRGGFVIGRWCGLVAILAANTVVMLALITAVLRFAEARPGVTTFEAILLIGIELALMSSVAVLFSSFSTPMLAGGFAFSLFLIGHLVSDLRAFGQRSKSEAARAVAEVFYRLLPNLELLNIKSQAANHMHVSGRYVATAALYGLAYTAILLGLSVLIFRRRDLR